MLVIQFLLLVEDVDHIVNIVILIEFYLFHENELVLCGVHEDGAPRLRIFIGDLAVVHEVEERGLVHLTILL